MKKNKRMALTSIGYPNESCSQEPKNHAAIRRYLVGSNPEAT